MRRFASAPRRLRPEYPGPYTRNVTGRSAGYACTEYTQCNIRNYSLSLQNGSLFSFQTCQQYCGRYGENSCR